MDTQTDDPVDPLNIFLSYLFALFVVLMDLRWYYKHIPSHQMSKHEHSHNVLCVTSGNDV